MEAGGQMKNPVLAWNHYLGLVAIGNLFGTDFFLNSYQGFIFTCTGIQSLLRQCVTTSEITS